MTIQTTLCKKYPGQRWLAKIGINNVSNFLAQAAISSVVSIGVTVIAKQFDSNA